MAQLKKLYFVEIHIGEIKHAQEIKAANTHLAVRRVSEAIKNFLMKLECHTPSADVYERGESGDIRCAHFNDVRLLML